MKYSLAVVNAYQNFYKNLLNKGYSEKVAENIAKKEYADDLYCLRENTICPTSKVKWY